jgi:hypothetical protein
MPPKSKIPAPIDRPLSKAYLRQFTGWSTAYPPGVSEPNSLRLMENMMVNRDGSCRIRPGLRYLNYSVAPVPGVSAGEAAHITTPHVGTHEPFFNEYGKCYLYAVREVDDTVGFRVWASTSTGGFEIQTLTEAEFEIPQGEAQINFTADTTYVKYLQIDNKVFALSDAGESMRMFSVGNTKKVQRLYSIERPEWSKEDKLTVVHPEAAWITSGDPIATRRNLVRNPSVETSMDKWSENTDYTKAVRSDDIGESGSYSMKLSSRHERRNILPRPLNDVGGGPGTSGWSAGFGCHSISVQGTYMRIRIDTGTPEERGWALSPSIDVTGGARYIIALDVNESATTNIDKAELWAKFYKANGDLIGGGHEELDTFIGVNSAGRKVSDTFVAPDNAATMVLQVVGDRSSSSGIAYFEIKNMYIGLNSEGNTAALDGNDGADYYWEGTTNNSPSVYHPAKDISVIMDAVAVSPSSDYYASAYGRALTTVRNMQVKVRTKTSADATIATTAGTGVNDGSGVWVRAGCAKTTESNAATVQLILEIDAVPRDEFHYLDSVLFEKDNALNAYFSGATPDVVGFDRSWDGTAHDSISIEEEYAGALANPTAETPTADTLVSNTSEDNDISFGFFYTFSTEIGETAASQTTTIRTQRPWSSWKWETANGAGEPSGTETRDPELCADQLVAYMPEDVFDDALAFGAISWTLYMFTWSNQDPFPVSAIQAASRTLAEDSVYGTDSWLQVTPSQSEVSANLAPIPTRGTLINASYPSHGGQGIVAADRMVMVLDPNEQAVTRWSSNQQGSYIDFSPSKGGGFKTLTSGNLFIPACVKLWQNPQSVDTLTVLMLGVDAMSTAYYMQPAQVASQSEAVNLMAFEETTATPGTVSPYGCEVMNNSLYHPLDDQLMKSTASNYNINHMSVTEKIQDQWVKLSNKQNIVASQHDMRLYFLVHNPSGENLLEGCMGNEVWVFDGAAKNGTWSRWLTQGITLRKIEVDGRVHMSLVQPDGIYYFDYDASTDDYYDSVSETILSRNIPWLMETNTQGANRAHDAWAQLQQANVVLGFFQGMLRVGVRGYDVNGKVQDISKIVRDPNAAGSEAWDLEDFLLIRRTMKEWYFYASSYVNEDDELEHSAGQISLVQYRYTPSTVNTGYEFGSVETFEYGRAGNDLPDRTTDSGTPISYIDSGRP